MPAPQAVLTLVENFERNLDAYRSGKYNETQVRRDFIDPLFKALGWDMDNSAGYAEAYRDVIHEDAIKIGSSTKAPDYSFRIGGQRKFFLEAKKPSVNVKDDVEPAFQLRRYAWSAKLPLSIVTDFEEFAIYDCRAKPDKGDKASKARLFYCTFRDYAAKWDEIAAIFSKEAVLKGSFDRYATTSKGKRGTSEVDSAFLEEIEGWRDLLARNIALRNANLSQRELNFAVQQTIDRIIFLRICEDRGIEPYGRLMALQNGANVYGRLREMFRDADDRYNSGLFHFKREKGRAEAPDELTLNLEIDDKPLKEIFKHLYYPDCPYEFSVLGADILGQVYEQFLGKVIRLTAGNRAVVEDKPEVKKAGGVFYTPAYIVQYIVQHTVGKLLEGKTPKQAKGIAILDPACGSGSFLIGAYQYLLDWYLARYVEEGAEKHSKGKDARIHPAAHGAWRLTTAEKKRILLEHIYGVDIDAQAVEVTKLSLLLKMLEGESDETLNSQMKLFHERVLPDLEHNIQCGNSLIGPDFYDGQLDLDDEAAQRINVFDWQAAFPHIFKAGGFDAVIGNPPYIRIQTIKEWAPLEVEHYKERYVSASKGNYDIYVVFVERGLQLLDKKGLLGFILPHKFFNAQYGEPLRGLIAQGRHLADIVHFGHQQIFAGATTYTCLLFLSRDKTDNFSLCKVDDLEAWLGNGHAELGEISASRVSSSEWNFTVGRNAKLFERLNAIQVKLGDIADIFVGLQTSADDVFILEVVGENKKSLRLKSKALGTEQTLEKDLLFPLVSGTDVTRYGMLPERQYIIFPYCTSEEVSELIGFEEITEHYPATAAYLQENRKRLEDRENGKFKDAYWYRFGRNQNIGIQGQVKICVPRLVDNLCAAYDDSGIHYLDNVDVGGVTLKPKYVEQGQLYLLGLLNSRLLRWYFPHVSAPFRGGWMSANRQFLSQLPIHTIDFANTRDNDQHNHIVALVERMLALHQQLAAAKTPQDSTLLQRQIDATDKQIDQLVYTLYGLTDGEIALVENA